MFDAPAAGVVATHVANSVAAITASQSRWTGSGGGAGMPGGGNTGGGGVGSKR